MLYKWAEKGNFVWLVTEDILDEYKEVLKRLRVRSTLIGAVINLIHERAEPVNVHGSFEISPDPKDDPFCLCSEEGNADFIVTLNPKDFPQERLRAKVISPEAMAVASVSMISAMRRAVAGPDRASTAISVPICSRACAEVARPSAIET